MLLHGDRWRTTQKPYIYIKGKSSGNNIIFIIEDAGCGISAAKLAEIQKVLAADLNPVQSSGIGLKNINQRIKTLLGEQCGLNIESKEGSFVRFILTITKIVNGYPPRTYVVDRKRSNFRRDL